MTNKNSPASGQLLRLDRADADRDEQVYEAEWVENRDQVEPAAVTSVAYKLGKIAGGVGSILFLLLGLGSKGGDPPGAVGGGRRRRGRRREARGKCEPLRRRQV